MSCGQGVTFSRRLSLDAGQVPWMGVKPLHLCITAGGVIEDVEEGHQGDVVALEGGAVHHQRVGVHRAGVHHRVGPVEGVVVVEDGQLVEGDDVAHSDSGPLQVNQRGADQAVVAAGHGQGGVPLQHIRLHQRQVVVVAGDGVEVGRPERAEAGVDAGPFVHQHGDEAVLVDLKVLVQFRFLLAEDGGQEHALAGQQHQLVADGQPAPAGADAPTLPVSVLEHLQAVFIAEAVLLEPPQQGDHLGAEILVAQCP
ncbi:hypothetical protein TYRP_015832 [Tyrophagus putrescentiae]|nr:hypothetical protein TYRP_015832 [Tyrophagus putrescentiae]